MPRRSILTARQRAALFDLPTDDASMLRHYTLVDDDLEIVRARRRPHNRFGFALQLCALRYPGRLLAPGEVIPLAVTRFLAAQLGMRPDDLAGYATREETRGSSSYCPPQDSYVAPCDDQSDFRTAPERPPLSALHHFLRGLGVLSLLA